MDWRLLLYSVIPALAMAVTGLVAVYRPPGQAFRSAVLHLAAGVVFAVVGVEFLPDLLEERAPLATLVGFAAGAAAMLALRSLTRRLQNRASTGNSGSMPYGIVFGTAVDIVIDGVILGIGFAAGSAEGALLTFALTIELASLGLATVLTLGERRVAPAPTIVTLTVLAALFSVSALAGVSFLQGLEGNSLAMLLAFGSAALLFLVTEELLIEAHGTEETPWLTAAFFLGFITLLLFEIL